MRNFWLVLATVALVACTRDPEHAGDTASSDGPAQRIVPTTQRIVPTTVAAAEYARELVGAERFAAVPDQVGEWSTRDFKAEPWGSLPRFARFAAEPLLAHRPDLVICNEWQASETVGVLRQAGVRVVVLPTATRWADVQANLTLLGEQLGRETEAEACLARWEVRLAALRARATSGWRAIAYTNDGSGGTASGDGTTIRTIMEMAGLQDVSGVRGHAVVDYELLIVRDPDVLVVGAPSSDERGATEALLRSDPVLRSLRAVQLGRIAVLPTGLYSTDSPTILEAAELLVTRIEALQGSK